MDFNANSTLPMNFWNYATLHITYNIKFLLIDTVPPTFCFHGLWLPVLKAPLLTYLFAAGNQIAVILIGLAGVLQPSLTSSLYFAVFLFVASYWSLNNTLGRRFGWVMTIQTAKWQNELLELNTYIVKCLIIAWKGLMWVKWFIATKKNQ